MALLIRSISDCWPQTLGNPVDGSPAISTTTASWTRSTSDISPEISTKPSQHNRTWLVVDRHSSGNWFPNRCCLRRWQCLDFASAVARDEESARFRLTCCGAHRRWEDGVAAGLALHAQQRHLRPIVPLRAGILQHQFFQQLSRLIIIVAAPHLRAGEVADVFGIVRLEIPGLLIRI